MIVRHRRPPRSARARQRIRSNAAATPHVRSRLREAGDQARAKNSRQDAWRQRRKGRRVSNAATRSTQISQGAKRPQPRPGAARRARLLRRIRPEGDRARPFDGAPDRSRAPCDDAAISSAAAGSGSACFPDKPISQKPAEVRMGNGKGNPEYWVAEVKPGKVRVRARRCERSSWRAKRLHWPRPSCR